MLRLLLLAPLLVAAPSGRLVVCDHIVEPPTLDPQRQFAEKSHTIAQQIYEGLVRFDPAGRIEPALAESWKWLDGGGLEFKLRRGVTFHDGAAFDAAAVKSNIERYLNPETGFPGRGFLLTIKAVEVVEPHVVRVLTHGPDGLLLNRLAGFVVMASPGSKELDRKPVGTGPFRFESWKPRHSITLKANPGYWDKSKPGVAELVFRFIPLEAQFDALLSGEVDVLTDIPGTASERVASSGKARVIKTPSFYTIGATLNTRQGPLKDKKVRQALNYAVDRRDLMRYDQLGNAAAIASLSMPGEIGHDPSLKPYPHDPAKARKLLAEAGYPSGLTLRALIKQESSRTAQILRRQWEQVGIKLDVTWTNDADVMKDTLELQPDMGLGGCPDPMASSLFITSIYLYSKSPFSLTGSEQLDALLEKAQRQPTPAALEAALREADRFVYDEALSLFTYQRIIVAAVREGVDFKPYVTGMPHLFGAKVR